MSNPDASATKSLEEILASIRKSLAGAGEGSEAARGPRGATPVRPAPEPEPLADAAGDGDGLSARLAGALNGPTNGAALDDDFMELLAPDGTRPVPPEADATAKPADARSEGRDPLWFLRQPAAAAQSDGAPAPVARTQPAEGAPPLPQAPAPAAEEEVKLSRPEVLRASLPPLFGAEAEHPAVARTAPDAPKPPVNVAPPAPARAVPAAPIGVDTVAPGSTFTARTQPSMPPPQPAGETAKAAAAPETPPAPAAREPALFREAAPDLVADAAPGPQPPAEAKPANGLLGKPHADAAAKPPPTPVQEPSAAKPAPAAEAPAARSLEQVIGEMLEPFIRQWLDANLPRMVDQVVREEVARAIAASPRVPKV
jgi:cell pole-organizing protein PopZ